MARRRNHLVAHSHDAIRPPKYLSQSRCTRRGVSALDMVFSRQGIWINLSINGAPDCLVWPSLSKAVGQSPRCIHFWSLHSDKGITGVSGCIADRRFFLLLFLETWRVTSNLTMLSHSRSDGFFIFSVCSFHLLFHLLWLNFNLASSSGGRANGGTLTIRRL